MLNVSDLKKICDAIGKLGKDGKPITKAEIKKWPSVVARSYKDTVSLMLDDGYTGPYDLNCPECGVEALYYIDDGECGVVCFTTSGCVNSYDDPRDYSGF